MTTEGHDIPHGEWDANNESPHEVHENARRALKTAIAESPETLDGDLIAGALSDASEQARSKLAKSASLITGVVFGGERSKLEEIHRSLDGCRKKLAVDYKQVGTKLDRTDPTVRINEDAPPLHWLDYVTICLLVLICIGLVTIAFIGTPSYMLNFVTESYALAYSTAFLGLALPVGLHTAATLFQSESAGNKYLATICVISFICVISWITLNAFTYGGLMLDDTAELPPASVGISLMMLSMLAEGFTTAAGWLGVEHIVSKRMKSITNPKHTQLQKDYDRVGGQLARTQGFIAAIKARISAIESAEQLYVDRTLAVYDQLKQQRDFPHANEFLSGNVRNMRSRKPKLS